MNTWDIASTDIGIGGNSFDRVAAGNIKSSNVNIIARSGVFNLPQLAAGMDLGTSSFQVFNDRFMEIFGW